MHRHVQKEVWFSFWGQKDGAGVLVWAGTEFISFLWHWAVIWSCADAVDNSGRFGLS